MMATTQDRVNVYLPRSLKDRYRAQFGADGASFSELLRLSVIQKLNEAQPAASEPDGDRVGG